MSRQAGALQDRRSPHGPAVWELARLMRDTLERFDPTGSPDWDELDDSDREFYADVVAVLLDAKLLIHEAWKG